MLTSVLQPLCNLLKISRCWDWLRDKYLISCILSQSVCKFPFIDRYLFPDLQEVVKYSLDFHNRSTDKSLYSNHNVSCCWLPDNIFKIYTDWLKKQEIWEFSMRNNKMYRYIYIKQNWQVFWELHVCCVLFRQKAW